MTRIPGVPEMIWGTPQAVEQVFEDQQFGCSGCLVEGIYEPPSTVFFINGTTACAAHARKLLGVHNDTTPTAIPQHPRVPEVY